MSSKQLSKGKTAAMAASFFEQQDKVMEEMRRQQAEFLKRFGEGPPLQPPRKRLMYDEEDDGSLEFTVENQHKDDERLTLHVTSQEKFPDYDDEDNNSVVSEEYHNNDYEDEQADMTRGNGASASALQQGSTYLNAHELEDFMTSQHGIILDTVEEEFGKPIAAHLVRSYKTTWNNAKLDAKKKKKILKDVKIPKNMKCMKTAKLNTEIYIKLNQTGREKDEASANRQREVTRAAMEKISEVQLKFLERAKRDQTKNPLSKFEKESLKEAYEHDQTSFAVLNYLLTDNTRKRMYAAMANLVRTFTPFASIKEETNENAS